MLQSNNVKCLCWYSYMATVLSGSWGLCKGGTCDFTKLLYRDCFDLDAICDTLLGQRGASEQHWGLAEEEVE